MFYQQMIREIANDLKLTLDPRHVEAAMRSDYGTLNHLDRSTFRQYCKKVAKLPAYDIKVLEDLAQMDGL
jgi:hypothetical protein